MDLSSAVTKYIIGCRLSYFLVCLSLILWCLLERNSCFFLVLCSELDVDVWDFLVSLFFLVLLLAFVLFLLLVTTLSTASFVTYLLIVLLFLFLLLGFLLLLLLPLTCIITLSCRCLRISLLFRGCSLLCGLCSISSFSLRLFLFGSHYFFVAICPSTATLFILSITPCLDINLEILLLITSFLLLLLPSCRLRLRFSCSCTC